MPVTRELVSQIDEYSKHYNPTDILDAIGKNDKYADVNKQVSELRKHYKDDEVLNALRKSPSLIKASSEQPSDANDMTTMQKFGAGMGGGMYMLGKGVQQKGAQIGQALGLVSPEAVKGITKEGESAKADLERLKSQSTAAKIGEFAGEALPAMAIPGGVAGGTIVRVATGAIAGAAQGGMQFTGEGESTASNVIKGASIAGAVPIVGKALSTVGKVVKESLGASTGAGPEMIEEALRGTQAFKDAMRGNTSGHEIVQNAKNAVQKLKDIRGVKYQEQLSEISKIKGQLDYSPISSKLDSLLKQYKIVVDNNGSLVFSGSKLATDKAAQGRVKEIFDVVTTWKDKSPSGLDTLKQALSNEYSENSAVRQLVTDIAKTTKETVSNAVPQYDKMTKGYAEASNLIKDIESNLMLRKQGISGRITEDQTLRRLTSAMRNNFEMRRDLVEVLGSQANTELKSQIAGYTARTLIPRGARAETALAVETAVGVMSHLNPLLVGVMASSSPRAVGEFMNIFGKAMLAENKITPAAYRVLMVQVGNMVKNRDEIKKAMENIPDLYGKIKEDASKSLSSSPTSADSRTARQNVRMAE